MPIWMYFALFIYILACLFLIFVILLQSGKGGGLSSLAGASQGLNEALGSTAGERTLNRLTYTAAGAFMLLAIVLTIGANSAHNSARNEFDSEAAAQTAAPVDASTLPIESTAPTAPASSDNQPVAVEIPAQPAAESSAAPAPAEAGPAAPAPAPALPAGPAPAQ